MKRVHMQLCFRINKIQVLEIWFQKVNKSNHKIWQLKCTELGSRIAITERRK